MDELFWGREYEDVSDWAKRLTMVVEVRDLNADKLLNREVELEGQGQIMVKKVATSAN
jgi:hypothetical protein